MVYMGIHVQYFAYFVQNIDCAFSLKALYHLNESVLTSTYTHNYVLSKNMKNTSIFHLKIVIFTAIKSNMLHTYCIGI